MEDETTDGIYSLNELKNAYFYGRRFSFVYFNLFTQLNTLNEGCFSLKFPSKFADEIGEQYSDCYQYMISQEAKIFKDFDSYNQIIKSKNHDQMVKISHQIKNFNQDKWEEQSENIVFRGNLYKFSQNQELKNFLLSYPLDTIFVYADPTDQNWGIRLNSNDPRSYNPLQWEGKNKLGFQITKVRDHLFSLISTKIKPIYETPKVYNLKDLKNFISEGYQYIYIYFCFFDPKDKLLDPVTIGCLSQFFPSQFSDNYGRKYSDCIQYMMSQKAELFEDKDAFNKIMKCKDQNEMRKIGRGIKNFNSKKWNENSEEIVYRGNFYKFSQNQKLRDFLLSFPLNSIFVEADPDEKDTVWGIGMQENDKKAKDPSKWGGQNKLGFQITRARDQILNSLKNQMQSPGKIENRFNSDQSRLKTESNRPKTGTNKPKTELSRLKSESSRPKKSEKNNGQFRDDGQFEDDGQFRDDGELKNKGRLTGDSRKGELEKSDIGARRIESNKAQLNDEDTGDDITEISYAYESKVSQILHTEQVTTIDLLSTGITSLMLDNYPSLVKLRASKCYYLKKVSITEMPRLKVVDLLDDESLTDVAFKGCPKLSTLEVGFCNKLGKITGIESLKYLSAPKCTFLHSIELPKSIVFLDITDVPISDISPVIQSSKKLECLAFSKVTTLKLSEITANKSLKIIQLKGTKIICDSINDQTSLKIIVFESSSKLKSCAEGKIDLLNYFYVTSHSETNIDLNNFTMFDKFTPKYQKYQRMLYGPWPIPKVDLMPPVSIKKPIISPPSKVNQEKAANAILGSIIGSAVYDMLGVGVEFLPDGIAKSLLLGEMNITWSHPRINSNNERFVRSTPTDDTSQSILILRSIIDVNSRPNSKSKSMIEVNNVKIDPCDFAQKLIDWIENGHKEHKHYGALDVGVSTLKIAKNPLFKVDPIEASKQEWIKSGQKMAANGSIMRIASSGCFAFWDEDVVINVADIYSRTTHYDPRCVFCALSSALLISRYIQWNSGLISQQPDIKKALNDAFENVEDIEKYKDEIMYYIQCKNIEDLKLSEKNAIGYCLKAFGAGIWALKYCRSFEDGLVSVLREGGDADTNGAVVGALLGAKFGFNSIPKELIKYMFVGQWLFREIEPFMKLMGIKMPPSPYTQ